MLADLVMFSINIHLKLDVLGALVLEHRFSNELLELAVVEDRKLRHYLLGSRRSAKAESDLFKHILLLHFILCSYKEGNI